jgi:small subunit ribosomal protein S16
MSVKIRLSRIGKKKEPFFRIIAVDTRSKRDGKYLANIGTYDVLNSTIVTFHENVYDEWIAKGALPTDSAKKIYHMYKCKSAEAMVEQPTPKAKPEKKEKKRATEAVEKVVAQKEMPEVEKGEPATKKTEQEEPIKKEKKLSKE